MKERNLKMSESLKTICAECVLSEEKSCLSNWEGAVARHV